MTKPYTVKQTGSVSPYVAFTLANHYLQEVISLLAGHRHKQEILNGLVYGKLTVIKSGQADGTVVID